MWQKGGKEQRDQCEYFTFKIHPTPQPPPIPKQWLQGYGMFDRCFLVKAYPFFNSTFAMSCTWAIFEMISYSQVISTFKRLLSTSASSNSSIQFSRQCSVMLCRSHISLVPRQSRVILEDFCSRGITEHTSRNYTWLITVIILNTLVYT